jgi:hypothetical protein
MGSINNIEENNRLCLNNLTRDTSHPVLTDNSGLNASYMTERTR